MNGTMRRMYIAGVVLLIASAAGLFGQSVWEGNAAVSRYGELPATGYFASSNTFPANTLVTVRIDSSGKSVTVYVIGTLGDPGIFMLLSPQAAQALGIEKGTVVPVKAQKSQAGAQPGSDVPVKQSPASPDVQMPSKTASAPRTPSASPETKAVSKPSGANLLDSIRQELSTKSTAPVASVSNETPASTVPTAPVTAEAPKSTATGDSGVSVPQPAPHELVLSTPAAQPEKNVSSAPQPKDTTVPVPQTPPAPVSEARTPVGRGTPVAPAQDLFEVKTPLPSVPVPVRVPENRVESPAPVPVETKQAPDDASPETFIVKTDGTEPIESIPPVIPRLEIPVTVPNAVSAPVSTANEAPLPTPVPAVSGKTAPETKAAPGPTGASANEVLSFDGLPTPNTRQNLPDKPAVPTVTLKPQTVETPPPAPESTLPTPVQEKPAVSISVPEIREKPASEPVQPSMSERIPDKPSIPADAIVTLEPAAPKPPVSAAPEATPAVPKSAAETPVPAGGDKIVQAAPQPKPEPIVQIASEAAVPAVSVLPPASPAPSAAPETPAKPADAPEVAGLLVPAPDVGPGAITVPRPAPAAAALNPSAPAKSDSTKTSPDPVKASSEQPKAVPAPAPAPAAKESPAQPQPGKPVAASVPPAANQADPVMKLQKGMSYVQLGAYSSKDMAGKIAGTVPSDFPTLVVPSGSDGKSVFRLYVGPLKDDETGLILRMFKAKGFKDAYVRKGE